LTSFAREAPPPSQSDGAVSKIIENAMTAVVCYLALALETVKSAEHAVDDVPKSPRPTPRKTPP
jgi:hypothetical protein